MIESDNQGFLIGEPVAIDKTFAIWGNIGNDIKLIREALANGISRVPNQQAVKKPDAPVAVFSQPQGRSSGKNIKEINLPKAITKTEIPNRKTSSHSKSSSTVPGNTSRDPSTGRFVGKNIPGDSQATSHDRPANDNTNSVSASASMVADKIINAVGQTGSGLEDADPTVKAFSEISQPLTRGYEVFSSGTGRDQKVRNRWFRKIFGELKIFRAEESVFNKATNKILGDIEEKSEPGSGGKGGFLPFLGAGFMAVVLSVISKIPLIGALISSSGNILDMFKGGDKAKGIGGITGTFAGMLGGAKLGATAGAIGGPVVAAIGGLIGGGIGLFFGNKAGQVFGEKIGDWTDQLKQSDIGGKIVDTWKTFVGSISDKISSTWDAMTRFIKDKFDIDVKGKLSNAAETVKKSSVGKTVSSIAEKLNYATDKASEIFSAAKSKVTGTASENKDALMRQMKLSGITDPKEQAMFLAQMDHESAGFTRMEESFNYRSADRIMEVSKSARNKGRNSIEQAIQQGPEAVAELMYGGRMGNVNPGDGYKFRGRGHTQLTGRNNYVAAGKDLGIDLENSPDLASKPEIAAKIATWYWNKNNLGGAARSGNVADVTKRINGGFNGLGDREAKFASYMSSLNMPSTSNIAQSAVPNAGSIPRVPSIPKITDAPVIPEPLTSSSGNRNQPIKIESPNEVGQDVKDRKIAHIVTGGLSD